MGNLLQELKRRKVFKVAAVYVVIAWLMIQVVDVVLPTFNAPQWVNQSIILVLIIGLPIAIVLAWAFDITSEGIKKTGAPRPGEQTILRKRDYLLSAVLVLLVGVVVAQQLVLIGRPSDEVVVAAIEDKSIAVLPFADFSPDGDQQWFTDGLAEEILNTLVRTPDLNVASRTSSFAFKGSNQDVTEIAAALGVGHILEGSVRRSDTRLRITAQLIRAADGFHLWSENYDRTPDDAIAIQEDLAISISEALQTAMDPASLAAMADVGTESIAAYNAYLEGLAIQPCDGSVECMEPLERAIAIDPEFANAQYELARHWQGHLALTVSNASLDLSYGQMKDNFQRHITAAIESTSNTVDLLKYRALQASTNLQFANRMTLLEEYVAERPNDVTGWLDLADAQYTMGYPQPAQDSYKKALSVAGNSLDRLENNISMAFRYDDIELGRNLYQQVLTERPTDSRMLYQAHRGLLWLGELELASEAARLFANSLNTATNDPIELNNALLLNIRQACAQGRREDAIDLYEAALPIERIGIQWHAFMTLDRRPEAEELLRIYDTPETMLQLDSWSFYPQFDPRAYPEYMQVLEREGVNILPVKDVPFACRG